MYIYMDYKHFINHGSIFDVGCTSIWVPIQGVTSPASPDSADGGHQCLELDFECGLVISGTS